MRWSPGCACCGEPSVLTACCQTYDTVAFPDGGFVRVPAAAVTDANCTLPDFSNLIVEVNGQIRVTTSGSCDGNGSYSVPNDASCLLSGTSASGSCIWTARLPPTCNRPVQTWRVHLMVLISPGLIRGFYGFHRDLSACNASATLTDHLQIAAFELTYGGGSIPDLSNPVDIPCISTLTDSGGPYWDTSVPLTVYF